MKLCRKGKKDMMGQMTSGTRRSIDMEIMCSCLSFVGRRGRYAPPVSAL